VRQKTAVLGVPVMTDAGSLAPALKLHHFLKAHYWNGDTLGGPDQGVKWHIRVGRFVQSYFPILEGHDRFVFQQGQGYWALANWLLFDLVQDPGFRDTAVAATRATAEMQSDDGSWPYPLRERRHLKATVEGTWGALTLLRGYERTGETGWAEQALRWFHFLHQGIGFQKHGRGLAVNYFDRPRGKVPNNSVSVLWCLGEYHRILKASPFGGSDLLAPADALLTFLETVQLPNGEFPYELPSDTAPQTRTHYLCYQYNAFQCMRLLWYEEYTHDSRALELARRSAGFLATGVLPTGASRADCHHDKPEVVYYADALGMALYFADRRGLGDYKHLARRSFDWVVQQQRSDGGMIFSRGDYGCLSDRHAYPRYLAMTLYHLLLYASFEQEKLAAGTTVIPKKREDAWTSK
jgi:hypothetical protein